MRKRTKNIILISVVFALFISYIAGSSLFDPSSDDDNPMINLDTGFHYLDAYDLQQEELYSEIELAGNTLFLGQEGYNTVLTLNINNPFSITKDGDVANLKWAITMESYENSLYVSNNTGLFGFDVSDPLSPQLKGHYSEKGAFKMHAAGDYLYTIEKPLNSYFSIYNTSSTASDYLINKWTAPSTFIYFETMLIENNIAYLGYADGILLLDLSNPNEPTYLNEIELNRPTGMVVYNDILYVSDSFGLTCVNISDSSKLNVIKNYEDEEFILKNMISSNNILFACNELQMDGFTTSYLIALDIKNPYDVKKITKNHDFKPLDMVIDGDIMYAIGDRTDDNIDNEVFDGGEGGDGGQIPLSVVSIRISELFDISGIPLENTTNTIAIFDTQDIFKSGNFAYIADGTAGLKIYNISDHMNPVHIITKDTAGNANDIAMWGDILYIADGEDGVRAINVANINNPIEIGFNDTTGYTHSLFAQDYLLYTADGENGLKIFNITDPTSMNQTGVIDTPGNATDVEVFDKIAYVTDWNGGLRCINVSNPFNPIEIGDIALPSNAVNLKVYKDHVYIACGNSGVRVINIEDPTNPTEVSNYDASGNVTDIFISGDIAYLSVSNSKTAWINISTPNSPSAKGYITNTGSLNSIKIFEDIAFVAGGSNGLHMTKIKRTGIDDFDNDNLSYFSEIWNFGTNIDSNDTDGDGMDDCYESQFYSGIVDLDAPEYLIQPTVSDSYNDAEYDELTNLQEYTYGTDPFKEDTDGDGVSDYYEIEQGYDPLDSSNFPETMDWGLIIIALILLATIGYVAMSTMGVFEKKAPLNIFLSHAVIDFEPYRIKEMAETFGKIESVNKGLYCELDMKGNIDDWMDEMVPLSQIFVFIATKKSVFNSVDCGREIRLGHESGLFMIPIRTKEVEWKDIESINLPSKGFDYPDGKPKDLYKEIEENIKNIAENMDKVKKMLNKSDLTTLDILDNILELEKEDTSRLAKILIKSGRIKGAISKDGNQFLSEFEITRRIKLYKKKSDTLETSEIIGAFDIDEIYEDEISELMKKGKKGKKKRVLMNEIKQETQPEEKKY